MSFWCGITKCVTNKTPTAKKTATVRNEIAFSFFVLGLNTRNMIKKVVIAIMQATTKRVNVAENFDCKKSWYLKYIIYALSLR